MNPLDRAKQRAWHAEQRVRAQAAFPASDALLESLFACVEAQVAAAGCDHSLRFTCAWIRDQELSSPAFLSWLAEHGGHCDCEVVANAADHWEQNRP